MFPPHAKGDRVKCPHCGHPDRIHSGQRAQTTEPGSCQCGPPDNPCTCPGWAHWLVAGRERYLELQMEQDRVDKAWGASMQTLYEPDD